MLLFFFKQAKGINLSSDGLSVKTNKVKVSREEEVVSTFIEAPSSRRNISKLSLVDAFSRNFRIEHKQAGQRVGR